MYRFYNANTHDRFVNDCTIRAISLATGRDWGYTYSELSDEAQKRGMMMDNVDFIEDYLDERYERTCHYSKTVGEFIEEFPMGVFIISMPGHLTCVIDGVNYDTFDTTERKMWCCWKVLD